MESLENQFLIAMPSLDDSFFNKTVTYICEHNEDGAMGLIINLPVSLNLCELLKQIEPDANDASSADSKKQQSQDKPSTGRIKESLELAQEDEQNIHLQQRVLSGGPVAQQRGFVLHSKQSGWSSSLSLNDQLMITTSKDILLALGTDEAPDNFIVTLGYASWGPGQLEQELKDNSWLTTPVDTDIIFNTPVEQRWKKATEKLGIDLAHLSSDVGHA
ncbi:YqgE/AlgH family protein [Litorilituus lipolyticus]|uniref:UPF0301 protein EPA86_02810 n=1 Tax=Litorilituus lipolyticus TaxID=2491017 RepID=A0A502L4I1_9GAMM|nr:YqgE/AlgH family protein [Litorilituus lipolyticus]TPH18064.1 DUF179 domain-containing protein [Litorilituus lipolyticus]